MAKAALVPLVLLTTVAAPAFAQNDEAANCAAGDRFPPRQQDDIATERDADQTEFGMGFDQQTPPTSTSPMSQKNSRST